MEKTDLIIIGAGPGGYRAAEYAAEKGLKVTIIEQGAVGGTCLNVGCIPTKTYVHAKTFDEARERMSEVVPQLRTGVEGILAHPNITLVRGKACFADATTIVVKKSTDGTEASSERGTEASSERGTEAPSGRGTETSSECRTETSPEHDTEAPSFTAPNIIIATGSETKWLPIPGSDHPSVVDSTGLLALDSLPSRLIIIGAGVIGMEFAAVFSRFGCEVTVIEYLKECLPALDSDIAKRLRKQMEKRGITFHMQCAVKEIADGEVHFENKKGQMESVSADVILMATGRKPRTDGLQLTAAGITLTPQGAISVDDNYQVVRQLTGSSPLTSASSLPTIYAIGDVNGRQMLAHAAEMQAVRAVNHIIGRTDGIRFDIMPAAIFTDPEAACVGPAEDLLKAQGTPYECRKAFWRANGKAMAMGETEGMLKLLTTPREGEDSGRIIGCHAYGAHAADIVQEVSVLMCKDTTIEQLADMVHIHPTLAEILHAACC